MAGVYARRNHKHKPRVNRDDASISARKRNARLCLCSHRPVSHVAYACACVVRVTQPKDLTKNTLSGVPPRKSSTGDGLSRLSEGQTVLSHLLIVVGDRSPGLWGHSRAAGLAKNALPSKNKWTKIKRTNQELPSWSTAEGSHHVTATIVGNI